MSEKRFKKMDTIIDSFPIWDTVEEKGYNCTDTLDLLVDLLNEQQDQISYWKHKVNSLLWILGQFDEEKVKKLLKEIDDE